MIGQIIEHNKFGYRGVIFEVDPVFSLTEEWYEAVARSRPPKDKPWYHVLVDEGNQITYVAERHLSDATDTSEIRHPYIDKYFLAYDNGRYVLRELTM